MAWWKIGIAIVLLGALGWFGWMVTRPIPGTKVTDLGREHVTPAQVVSTTYNSNPPTSGPHLPTWVKPGVYDVPQSEGELIHSLEHGYVIISYNCGVHLSFIRKVYAHEEEGSPAANLSQPALATGSAITQASACTTLRQQLVELANKKRLWKLIVVPRPQLDTTIALTAWGYIDKFDQFDAARVERFIDFHRDQGPEKTME